MAELDNNLNLDIDNDMEMDMKLALAIQESMMYYDSEITNTCNNVKNNKPDINIKNDKIDINIKNDKIDKNVRNDKIDNNVKNDKIDNNVKNDVKIYNNIEKMKKDKEKKRIIDKKNKKLQNNINNILKKKKPSTNNERMFQYIYPKLNEFQKNVLIDCVKKNQAGISLPLGSGKTLLSIVISLYCNKDSNDKILVVGSLSLLSNWIREINKFFGDKLKYEVIHNSNVNIKEWKLEKDVQLVLTTIDVLAKAYKDCEINKLFQNQQYNRRTNRYITRYTSSDKPFINHVVGNGIFYSEKWGSLIIDEVQKYTNIETIWCQSLGAVSSKRRWLLSGTIFDEPKISRILGYYIILNEPNKPRSLPEMKRMLDSENFKGLNNTLIERLKNEEFKPPKVNEEIISHQLDDNEQVVYIMMKKILNEIKKRADEAVLIGDQEGIKLMNSYKLTMILYMRQCLICPLIPLTSISINASDFKKKTELSEIIMNELNKLGLYDWLDTEESIKSSRMRESIECINKHPNERIILFTCFKSYLDILEYFIGNGLLNRPVFRMLASMNGNARGNLIKEFENSNNGVMLLTYQLGAEGLNLQFASTVLLIDFWWNASKVQQAIGRIFRFGQMSEEINIYYFTANTGVEKILFRKQKAKLSALTELKTGNMKTLIPTLKMDDIIKLIEIEDNEKLLKDMNYI